MTACLLLSWVCLHIGIAQQSGHNFLSFGVAEGLPTSMVHQALQDQQGYMWFATSAGVVRFDGNRFETFTVTNGLAKNDVPAMLLDQSGAIWMMTIGALTQYHNSQFEKLDSLRFIKDERVLSMKQSLEGDLWIQTAEYLFYLPVGQTVPQEVKELHSPPSRLKLLFTGPDHQLWCYRPGELLVMKGNHLMKKMTIPSRLPTRHFAATQLQNGDVLFPATNGLYRIDSTGKLAYVPTIGEHPKWSAGISQLLEDREGHIWVSYAAPVSGVCQFKWTGNRLQSQLCVLKKQAVNHLFQDRESNVWFSTKENGVYLMLSTARQMLLQNRLFQEKIRAIQETHQSNWVSAAAGKDGSLILTNQAGKVYGMQEVDEPESQAADYFFPGPIVKSILLPNRSLLAINRQGELWIGSENKAQPIRQFEGVQNLFLVGEDVFLDCGYQGFSYRLPWKLLMDIPASPALDLDDRLDSEIVSLSFSQISDLTRDQQGNIWVADVEGLTKIDPEGKEQMYTPDVSALDARIDALAVGPEGEVFVGTNGSGIVIFKGKDYLVLDQSNGLGSNVCKSLTADSNGVWAGTNRGLAFISNIDFSQDYARVQLFSDKDGLLNQAVEDILVFDDGLLLKQAGDLIHFPTE
ncbi:MAG: two-component regulator propeller domain-containing protein, partial [Bacteroidota bacterium]